MRAESSSKYRVNPRIAWGLSASFLVAIVTGIVLAYPFDEAQPLLSTVGIENVVPFGWFFRRLHYWSGFFTLVLLFYHVAETLVGEGYRRRDWLRWLALCVTIPIMILIVFTGYVIRGDETGRFAGYIAESLILKIPLLGPPLNAVLFMIQDSGVHRAYLFHFYASLVLFFVSGIWHFRLRRLPPEDLLVWLLLPSILSLVYPLGLHAPGPHLLVKGPWFFLGIQEALRYFPPVWAGIVFPTLGILLYVGVKMEGLRKWVLKGLLVWTGVYTFFMVYGLWR